MGSWILFFLVIAIAAAVISLGGIAGTAIWMAQIGVFAFLVLCVAAFISGLRVVGQ